MAPSAGSGADRASAPGRQRSEAELKAAVISLVIRTRISFPSDCDGALCATHYETFQGVCRSWVAATFISADSARSADSSAASEKQQQTTRAVSDQLTALIQLVTTRQQRVSGDSRELVGVIVRSISAATEIQRRRRKRKLPTTLPVSDLAVAHVDAGTVEALSRVAELFGVWLLHSSGLLRFEDVLLGVVSSGSAEPYEWVTAPVHFLLDRAAQKLHLPSLPAPSSTHEVVEALLLYIIRLAFTDSRPTRAPFTSSGCQQSSIASHAIDQAAMRVLEELCFFTRNGFSILALRLVTQILSERARLLDQQQSVTNNSFGRMTIARDRIEAFLQPQSEKLASPYSLVQAPYTHGELEEIFSAYESCLSTSTFVQIVRQFIYEASDRSTSRDISPNAAVIGQPKSVIRDALYQLITSLATKRSDFVDHVLTLAHDLASEGVQGMNGFLLRHSLELVATVSCGASAKPTDSSSPDIISSSNTAAVDCYRDWVRDHFGAQDASTRKSSLDIVTSSDAAQISNRPAPPHCLKKCSTCSLVTSKRQIQFLCAFLLEFDRREQPLHPTNATTVPMYPVAKSSHVTVHLSVMKTHQPQFPSGGLIMDFCSQTRSRYLELLKIEQATSAATANSMEVAIGSALQQGTKQQVVTSLHSAKIRDMVREHVQLFHNSKKLSPLLRQWKMFQPQLWKQELIPCCLDIEFDNLSSASRGNSGDGGAAESKLLEHVALVHALAKSSLVTIHEYSHFLANAETWLESRQKRRKLKSNRHGRQRHGAAEDGKGLDHALELLEADMAAERNGPSAWGIPKQVSPETLDTLRGALKSSFESAVNVAKVGRGGPMQSDTATLARQIAILWEEGCVKVIRLLGLEQIDAYFTYLVPVFERSALSTQEDSTGAISSTAGQQDKDNGKPPHMLVADFFVSQVSWTEMRVDEMFLYEVSSLAAIVAALLGACGESQSHCSMSDIAVLIELIDEKCVIGGSSSSAACLLLHNQLLRRFLFYSTMLRAASALASDRQEAQARVLTMLLQCESLKPEIRDFISWVGYRSMVVVTGASKLTTPRDRQMAVHEYLNVQPFSLVLANLSALSERKCCRCVFNLKNLTIDQLRRVLTLEFRYGLKICRGAATSKVGGSSQQASSTTTTVRNPRDWLQTELDVIADFGGSQVASIEGVGEWIVTEILFQLTASSTSNNDDADELNSRNDAVELLLLVLNDLMHRLSLQQVESATSSETTDLAAKNHSFVPNNHGRILAYYVTSALKTIQATNCALPVNPKLQYHGFEVLEICARHQLGCRSSRDEAGGDAGDRALLELISEIGNHFQDQFPWSLLQALFFYLMRLLRFNNVHKDPYACVLGVGDLPTAIVIRCAIEYPRLRTVWERRGASIGMETEQRTQHKVMMRHLQCVHQFVKKVVDYPEGEDLDHGHEPGSNGNTVSTFSKGGELPLPAGMETATYQTLILKYLFRWNLVQVPDLTTQAHLIKSFFSDALRRILRAMDAYNSQKTREIAMCFAHEWLEIAIEKAEDEQDAPAGKSRPVDFHFQLFFVHAVAELCKQSGQVAKDLLRSWRNATSSAKSDGSALFIALLVISMFDGIDNHSTTSTNLFDQVLEMNSSIWVNEFPQIALHVLSVGSVSSEPAKIAIDAKSSSAKLIKVIANTQNFKERLTRALYKVLRHGIVNQVYVLDASLPRRIRQAWSTLSDIASQLPVLALDDASRAI